MAFMSISGGGTQEDLQNSINKGRLENAAAFQAYVSAKKANGDNVDPSELFRVKMSLSGGDPGAASLLPASDALSALAKQANEGAEATRQSISMSIADSAKKRQDFIQGIVDAQPHATQDEFNKNLLGIFGNETGTKFVQMYAPVYNNMATESRLRLTREIASNPMFQHVTDEKTAQRFLPNEWNDPKYQPVIKSMLGDQAFAKSEKVRTATLDVLSKAPESLALAPTEDQRKFFEALAPAGQADKAMAGYHAIVLGAENARIAKIAEAARTDPQTSAWVNTAANDEQLTSIAKELLAASGINITNDQDPRLLSLKGHLKAADMANDSIKYEAATVAAKVESLKVIQQEEKTNQESYAAAKAQEVVTTATKNNRENAYKSTLNATQALFGKDGEGGIVHASKSNMDMWFNHLQASGFDPNQQNAATFIDGFRSANETKLETRQDAVTKRASQQIEATLGPAPQPAKTYVGAIQEDVNQVVQKFQKTIKEIDALDESAYNKNQRKSILAQKTMTALTSRKASYEDVIQDPIKSRNLQNRDTVLELALSKSLSDAIAQIRLSQVVDPITGSASLNPSLSNVQGLDAAMGSAQKGMNDKKIAEARAIAEHQAAMEQMRAEIEVAKQRLNELPKPDVFTSGLRGALEQYSAYSQTRDAAIDYFEQKYGKYIQVPISEGGARQAIQNLLER